MEKYENAQADFRKVFKLEPSNKEARNTIAELEFDIKQRTKAKGEDTS